MRSYVRMYDTYVHQCFYCQNIEVGKKIEKRLSTKPTRLARNELVLYIKAIVSRVSVCVSVCLSVCLCVCVSVCHDKWTLEIGVAIFNLDKPIKYLQFTCTYVRFFFFFNES